MPPFPQLLLWTSTWASDYRGQWIDTLTLLVTAVAVPVEVHTDPRVRAAVAVGSLGVSVLPSGNLTSLDGTSVASNASTTVSTGSWGSVVCDGGVVVYSHTTLVVAFEPPANASYVPSGYTIEVAIAPDFTPNATRTLVVTPTSSASAVALPPFLPATALRYIMPGLTTGMPYHARVSVAPPALPSELTLPWPVPTVFRYEVTLQPRPGVGDALKSPFRHQNVCACLLCVLHVAQQRLGFPRGGLSLFSRAGGYRVQRSQPDRGVTSRPCAASNL